MTAIYNGYDQAGIDAQYNTRLAVPNHMEIIDRWVQDSETARATQSMRQNLSYGPHKLETLDLFYPAAHKPAVLIFIHGGYWFSLDKDFFSFLAPSWVDAGVAVAIINYPLSPEKTVPDIVVSVRRAVRWLSEEGATLGIDPTRLVVSGHSAGAHLATMAASDPKRPVGLKAGLAISGLYDLEPIQLSYLNAKLHLDAKAVEMASPARLEINSAAPLIVAVGGDETAEFHRQQTVLTRHWQKRALAIEVVDMPGTNHFTVVDGLCRPTTPLGLAVLRLM